MTKIELGNGKYTVIHDNGRGLHALRYGEVWLNLAGDNLVMAMAYEIEELKERLNEAESLLNETSNDHLELYYPELNESVYEFLYGGDDE